MSTPDQLRERRRIRKMRHECIHCESKLPHGYLWFTCMNCREERQVLRYGEDFDSEDRRPTKNPKWLALENAQRCPTCSLLLPCGGHRTIYEYAAMRRGD